MAENKILIDLIKEKERILYTSPMFLGRDDKSYSYYTEGKNFDYNPLEIIPVRVWYNCKNEYHLYSEYDLFYLMFGIRNIDERKSEFYDVMQYRLNMTIINKHHLYFNRYLGGIYFNRINFPSCGTFFENKEDALRETITKFRHCIKDFFMLLNKKSRQLMGKHQMHAPTKLSLFYDNFVSRKNIADIARFRKLIIMGNKIYRQCFKDIIIYDKTNLLNLNYKKLEHIAQSSDIKKFNEYMTMFSKYAHGKTPKQRDDYFKSYFNKKING